MNRIVPEHYPVADLPDDLKQLAGDAQHVRVVIEADDRTSGDDIFHAVDIPPNRVKSVDELVAMRRPPFRTTEEIVAEIRRQRDERDD